MSGQIPPWKENFFRKRRTRSLTSPPRMITDGDTVRTSSDNTQISSCQGKSQVRTTSGGNICVSPDNNSSGGTTADFSRKSISPTIKNRIDESNPTAAIPVFHQHGTKGNQSSCHSGSSSAASASQDTPVRYDVTISFCWDMYQTTVLRIHRYLIEMGYSVWIDAASTRRSSLEVRSHALESSRVVLLGVSHGYFRSSACKDEANYAHSLKKHIIPVILESKYVPRGWLGIILGPREWHHITDAVIDSDAVFANCMQHLIDDIGPPAAHA
eukprot:m.50192 g.50192  ORF g.50192 m.50192 type:complete len:270 (-) comp15364_c0_seq1:84-893(-)